MITNDQAQQLVSGGGSVVGTDDEKIGDIGQIFLDDRTDQPEWVTAKTGLFGSGESFVPLQGASVDGNNVRVPYDKATVKDAPRISDADGHLSVDDEDRLFAHYGVDDSAGTTRADQTSGGLAGALAGDDDRSRGGDRDTEQHVGQLPGRRTGEHTGHDTGHDGDHDGDRRTGPAAGDVRDQDLAGQAGSGAGHDTSGPNTDSAMTRSEEQLHVGTERRTTGRARLRKYVVTENVSTTVPVSHEEVRLEREPITDANIGDATSGGELTSEEHEVVLHEERPVVEKETVPVERVRVDVDTVAGEEQVDEQVRKEQVELDDSALGTPGTRDDQGTADRARRDEVDRG